MTLDATPDCAGLVDIIVSAQKIVDDLTERPWGSSSPSVYETGRLVSLAPWLTGHGERLRFLLAEQRPDGGWGLPDDGYALVPTLSATEALLSALGADPFRMGRRVYRSPTWRMPPRGAGAAVEVARPGARPRPAGHARHRAHRSPPARTDQRPAGRAGDEPDSRAGPLDGP